MSKPVIKIQWTEEMLAQVAAKYPDKTAFYKGDRPAYRAADHRGILDVICAHMGPPPPRVSPIRKWTDTKLAEEASKYETRADFQRGSASAYRMAYKRGLLDTICAHMVPGNTRPRTFKRESYARKWTKEAIAAAAAPHKTRGEFSKAEPAAYVTARKKGWLDEVCAHMQLERTYWTPETIQSEAIKYPDRSAFREGCLAAYLAARRLGILQKVCAHMEFKIVYRTDEDILSEARQFKTRTEFARKAASAYGAAIERGLLEQACAHMKPALNGFDKDKPGKLYYIRLDPVWLPHPLYKIGVTNFTVEHRFRNDGVTGSNPVVGINVFNDLCLGLFSSL
jgi:hypothetical protein